MPGMSKFSIATPMIESEETSAEDQKECQLV